MSEVKLTPREQGDRYRTRFRTLPALSTQLSTLLADTQPNPDPQQPTAARISP